jgi:hypothetical protein
METEFEDAILSSCVGEKSSTSALVAIISCKVILLLMLSA